MPDERRTDQTTRDRIDELRDELHAEVKASHDELDDKFDERADTNSDAARRAFRVVITAIVIFGFGLSAAGLIFRHQNNQRVSDIQDSRRESAALSCMDTNARHDNALIEFDKLLLNAVGVKPKKYSPKLPTAVRLDRYDRDLREALALPRVQKNPRLEQIKASAATTPFLINALVPRRDCVAYVRRLIKN